MSKEKPDITRNIIITNEKGEIVEYYAIKDVTKIGKGGHVLIPNKLLGRKVEVKYKK